MKTDEKTTDNISASLNDESLGSYSPNTILYRSKRHYDIQPHSKAPVFSLDSNPQLVFDQLFAEFTSQNFSPTQQVFELFRQASLVNLYFFLTVVCAASGPYDQLTDHLHLDMCNFRQSDACM